MQKLTDQIKNNATILNGGLLVAQALFSIAFVGSCEIPNLIGPSPDQKVCLERWMTVSALFIPSGLNNHQAPPSVPATTRPLATPRRTTRRSTSTHSNAKK